MLFVMTDDVSVRVTKITSRIGVPSYDIICSTMAFTPLRNSDHVVVSVSIDFPSNSKQDVSFHCIAYDYSCADSDDLHDHLRDVPWEDNFKLALVLLLMNFMSGFRLGWN